MTYEELNEVFGDLSHRSHQSLCRKFQQAFSHSQSSPLSELIVNLSNRDHYFDAISLQNAEIDLFALNSDYKMACSNHDSMTLSFSRPHGNLRFVKKNVSPMK